MYTSTKRKYQSQELTHYNLVGIISNDYSTRIENKKKKKSIVINHVGLNFYNSITFR